MSETKTKYNFRQFNSRIVDYENETAWKKARKQGVGASEVAAIFGAGYASQSIVTVWASKTGAAQIKYDEATLRIFKRGHKLEQIIASEFADETGLQIYNPGKFTVFQHAEIDHLFATLDRYVIHPEHGPIPLELKAVNGRLRGEWSDGGELPLKFQIQCQAQMDCTGTGYCYLAALIGGDEFVYRLIERNQDFIDAMHGRLGEFWWYVIACEIPPVDESEATSKMLGLIYPHDDGQAVTLPTEFDDLDQQLTTIKEELKKLEAEKTGIENRIKAEIGEATKGVLSSGSFSWKEQSREGLDAKRLQAEFPDVYSECAKTTSFRVLRRSNK